jgi:hypothetical protein
MLANQGFFRNGSAIGRDGSSQAGVMSRRDAHARRTTLETADGAGLATAVGLRRRRARSASILDSVRRLPTTARAALDNGWCSSQSYATNRTMVTWEDSKRRLSRIKYNSITTQLQRLPIRDRHTLQAACACIQALLLIVGTSTVRQRPVERRT